jgi:putative DNA primase/helicase
MWRRLLRVDWNHRPENPDPNLREKLLAEKSGIFNWLLAGARDWYEFGLQPPEAVQAATKEYREGEDTLKDFIDGFRLDPAASIASSSLYREYRAYAEENGLRQMSAPAFKDAMRERGFEHRHTRTGSSFLGIGCKL